MRQNEWSHIWIWQYFLPKLCIRIYFIFSIHTNSHSTRFVISYHSFIFLKKEETRWRRKNTYWINYEWCVVDVVVSLDARTTHTAHNARNRVFPLEPPSQLADLGINMSRESNLSLGSLSCPHTFVDEEQAAAERPKHEKHKPRFLFLSTRFLLLSTRVQQETFLPSPN